MVLYELFQSFDIDLFLSILFRMGVILSFHFVEQFLNYLLLHFDSTYAVLYPVRINHIGSPYRFHLLIHETFGFLASQFRISRKETPRVDDREIGIFDDVGMRSLLCDFYV